jgi:MarR family transcriptional regulator, organic hydroperoxide resistance regulator
MTRALSGDEEGLIQAERDILARVGDLEIDFDATAAVSNIYRVATAVRYHMEKHVLSEHHLSWSAFVALWVLWVWGEMESHRLADETGVTKGSLTGIVKTLERRGLCERRDHPSDRRRVIVRPTATGQSLIQRIYPLFNRHESLVVAGLSNDEKLQLADHLRTVLRTVESLDGSE